MYTTLMVIKLSEFKLLFNVCLSPSNDLALLKLDKSPIMTDSVGVACLPEAGEMLPPGTACYISGWGDLYSKVLSSLWLQI